MVSTVFAGQIPQYKIIQLQSFPNATFNKPLAISDNGVISGTSASDQVVSGYPLAVVWLDYEKPPIFIGGQGISISFAYGVNSSGTVVGVLDDIDALSFYWDQSNENTSVFSAEAIAINDNGVIVGSAFGDAQAVAWFDGKLVDIEDQVIDGLGGWTLYIIYIK